MFPGSSAKLGLDAGDDSLWNEKSSEDRTGSASAEPVFLLRIKGSALLLLFLRANLGFNAAGELFHLLQSVFGLLAPGPIGVKLEGFLVSLHGSWL